MTCPEFDKEAEHHNFRHFALTAKVTGNDTD